MASFLVAFVFVSLFTGVACAVTYSTDEMTGVNAAVADYLASEDIPEGIDVDLELGILSGDLTDLNDIVGKELVFVQQESVDPNPDASGASWAEDESKDAMDFETFLGASGFHIGMGSDITGGSLEKVGAMMATMEMVFTEDSLLAAGVSSGDVEWIFSHENAEEVKNNFFDNFTYFKIFDGADPALDPVDIVSFIKTQYTESFPDFVEFERDVTGDTKTVTVGITFVLLDEASPDGNPLVLDKDVVVDLGDGDSISGLLFIYDGNRNNEFRDPISLGSEAESTSDDGGSSGSSSSSGCTVGAVSPLAVLLVVPLLMLLKK